jgi:hypothetical protein
MTHALFLSSFRQACSVKGCPLCTLAKQETHRYLSNLLYEYTSAPDIHQRLAQTHGLCNRHAWLLQYIAHAEQKDGMGVAIFYGSILTDLLEDLEVCLADHRADAPSRGRSGRGSTFGAMARARLRTQGICLACEHQTENERFNLMQLLEELAEAGESSELARLYLKSDGACLPHFLDLMEQAPTEAVARWFAQTQHDKLAELGAQLEKYVRLHDVRYKGQPMGEEWDSWVRVIEQTIGKRAVPLCRPDHQ